MQIKHLFLAVVFGQLTACASYTDATLTMREAYRSGRYEVAEKAIDESPLKEQSRNKLLYLLEKGMISDRLEKRLESRKLLLEADRHADRLQTVSVSREAATYVYNESAQEYAGEDYEKVAIHSMLALSFLEEQDLASTRIEARKINTKLDEINGKYDDDAKNRYKNDAFALYLSGSIYDALGESDNAIIDYKKALAVYDELYSKEFNVSAPGQIVRALYAALKKRSRSDDLKLLLAKHGDAIKAYESELAQKKNNGEVLVFHELGTIAVKQANDFYIPFGGQVVRLSFPIVRPRSYSDTGGITVKVNGSPSRSEPELVQNLDTIAARTLDDRRLRLVLKQGARLLVKGQITEQANRNFGPIAGIAANIYSAVTETADTRGWSLLPGAIYATRLSLPPGKHNIHVRYPGFGNNTFNVDVKPQKLTILRSKPEKA